MNGTRKETYMGIIGKIREEIQVIRERDPALHSVMEVFLYPSLSITETASLSERPLLLETM